MSLFLVKEIAAQTQGSDTPVSRLSSVPSLPLTSPLAFGSSVKSLNWPGPSIPVCSRLLTKTHDPF